MSLSAELLILVAVFLFIAAFIHGSMGFGFPMVATPLLALVTDIQTAIVLTLIPNLLVNTMSIKSEGDIAPVFRKFLPLATLALIGSTLGTFILIYHSSELFKILLAIGILVYLYLDHINLKLSWIRQHPQISRFMFGISAGVMGGLTNVMVPVLIIYFLESRYSKSEMIQALNLCFLFGKAIQLILFSLAGYFTEKELVMSLQMLLVITLALYIGIQIKKKIRPGHYEKLLRFFLLGISLFLILKTGLNL